MYQPGTLADDRRDKRNSSVPFDELGHCLAVVLRSQLFRAVRARKLVKDDDGIISFQK
jgi:hypothetical protein